MNTWAAGLSLMNKSRLPRHAQAIEARCGGMIDLTVTITAYNMVSRFLVALLIGH